MFIISHAHVEDAIGRYTFADASAKRCLGGRSSTLRRLVPKECFYSSILPFLSSPLTYLQGSKKMVVAALALSLHRAA